MADPRKIEVEPEADDRWSLVDDDSAEGKAFDERGDAEARAVARARATGGAEVVVKDDTGEIDRRRLVEPD